MSNNELYKTLFDLAINCSEEKIILTTNDGNIFLVEFSHLDIDIRSSIDEYKDSRGLVYKIIKVLKNVSYDYSQIFIEITRNLLPKSFKIVNDLEVS